LTRLWLEFPDLESHFWDRDRDQGLVVIGLHPGGLFGADEPDALAAFAAQTGATFPLGYDLAHTYKELIPEGGISPFPLDVVIAPDGTIAYVSREFDVADLRAVIQRLLPPPAE